MSLQLNKKELTMDRKVYSNRIIWLDKLKCLAIILVVWGHLPFASAIEKDIIYSFHMPLFFMISGFLYYPREKTIKKNIIDSFISLMIPYYAFGFFLLIAKSIIAGRIYFSNILSYLTGDLLWFFPCLFIIKFIMELFHPIDKKKTSIYLIIYILSLPFIYDIFSNVNMYPFAYLYDVVYFIPYFVIGFLMQAKIQSMNHSLFLGLLLIVICSLGVYYLDINISKLYSSYSDLFIRMLIATIGSLGCFHICTNKLSHYKLHYRSIFIISMGTSLIYPIHIIIIYILSIILETNNYSPSIHSVLLDGIISFIIVFLFIIPTNFILSKYPQLLGKKRG